MRQDKQAKNAARLRRKCRAAFQKQNAGVEQWPWFYAGWMAKGKEK
jgi:hypothetical protein